MSFKQQHPNLIYNKMSGEKLFYVMNVISSTRHYIELYSAACFQEKNHYASC